MSPGPVQSSVEAGEQLYADPLPADPVVPAPPVVPAVPGPDDPAVPVFPAVPTFPATPVRDPCEPPQPMASTPTTPAAIENEKIVTAAFRMFLLPFLRVRFGA